MAELPLVCICIPAYNAEATIRGTLSSVLKQTYPNFRVLVLDNASTDRTVEIVESFRDERVIVHRSETNVGAGNNFNRCIELAGGKYTGIFHADEVYEPDMVAAEVEVLEGAPEVGAVFTEASLIDAEGRIFGETMVAKYVGRRRGEIAVFSFAELFPIILRSGNFLLFPSALVRTKIYKAEFPSWRLDLFLTSIDLDMWLRILERYPVALILRKLMRTRVTTAQASHRELRRNTNRADMFLVLDHYLGKARPMGILGESDLRGYARLQSMDTARRAMNLYLLGERGKAAELLKGSFTLDLVAHALDSRRNLLTMLLIAYLKIVLLLGVDALGLRILQFLVVKTKR